MIQTNEALNTARMVANNGQDFIEGTDTNTGEWYGFQPHKDGCKITEINVENDNGDEIDETNADLSSLVGTTLDLDSFCGAPPVLNSDSGRLTKGYFTSVKLASGAATFYRDTKSK